MKVEKYKTTKRFILLFNELYADFYIDLNDFLEATQDGNAKEVFRLFSKMGKKSIRLKKIIDKSPTNLFQHDFFLENYLKVMVKDETSKKKSINLIIENDFFKTVDEKEMIKAFKLIGDELFFHEITSGYKFCFQVIERLFFEYSIVQALK